MLVSRQHRVAFAHYPKTAGSSLQRWFLDTFPDATPLVRENPHLTVTESLDLLAGHRWQRRLARLRAAARVARLVSPTLASSCAPWQSSLRVIGVVREPFEMLVSLYEFWKRHPFAEEPAAAFIRCARQGNFRDFLAAAVIGGCMPSYDVFFDVGGPLWRRTTLIEFSALEPALHAVCADLGIAAPGPLQRLKQAPEGGRDLDRYREQAGPLMAAVRQHFRWYYEEAAHLAVRGPAVLRRAA